MIEIEAGVIILILVLLVSICNKLGFSGWKYHRRRDRKTVGTDIVFIHRPCFICGNLILSPKGAEHHYTICHACQFDGMRRDGIIP